MTHSESWGPLAGVRILDLTQALAGPFATMILADLGADVVKIEPPTGDLTRTTPPFYLHGDSLYFLSHNRNKKGICIDLKTPDGRKVFEDLVRTYADVVIYNYGPGVIDRLGLAHEVLIRLNPKVITCNLTGFGRQGPEAQRRAVDVIVQAMAGAMSITGESTGPPLKAGIATADLSAGLYAAIGILSALVTRAQTNEGVAVETSLFHAQLSLLCYVGSYALYSGVSPARRGSAHIGTVPSQTFATADGYIAVDAGFDKHYQELCKAIGRPDLAVDEQFIDRPSRAKNRSELIPQLEEVFATRATDDWVTSLDARGVPVGPVNSVLEALESEQANAYRSVRTIRFEGEEVSVLGTPIWVDGIQEHPMSPPPKLGQHTRAVLADILGYDGATIDELVMKHAIAVNE